MTQLISKALDGPLSWLQRLALGIHLLGCPPCRRFRRAVQWLHTALPAAPCEACLSSAARDRIRRALEEAAGN